MVKDHTKTSTELKELASGGKFKAELPTALECAPEQARQAQEQERKGLQLGLRFDAGRRPQDAVSLFERYAKGGDNADLKNWAGKTLPALKHQHEMAQALSKSR